MIKKKLDHQTTKQKKSRGFSSFLLVILSVWFVWQWVFAPMRWIEKAEKNKIQSQKQLQPLIPNDNLIKRLKLYLRAKRSPLFRKIAIKHIINDISDVMNPSRIHRSYRSVIFKKKWLKWNSIAKRWTTLIIQINKLIPFISLDYLYAYIYLHTGQFTIAQKWGKRWMNKIPTKRQDTLLQIWLGHGSFWTQQRKIAIRYYNNAITAINAHPQWLRRSSSNWRLPAEITTSLYHLGLLYLQEKQLNYALKSFQRLNLMLQQQNKHLNHARLWYQVNLWIALIRQKQNKLSLSQKQLINTLKFKEDHTLQHFLFAKTFSSSLFEERKTIYLQLSKQQIRHRHSYPDSNSIAQLYLATTYLEQHKIKLGLKTLRILLQKLKRRRTIHTIMELFARNTSKIRFLPIAPSVFKHLLSLLNALNKTQTSRQDKPTSQQHKATTKPTTIQYSLSKLKRELHLYRALSLMRLCDWDSAIKALRKLLHQNEGLPLRYLGLITLKQGRFRLALSYWKKAYKLNPDIMNKSYLIYTFIRTKQYAQAEKYLHKKPKISKKWRDVYKELHQLLKMKKRTYSFAKSKIRLEDLIGYNGMLATHDPYLKKSSRIWRLLSDQESSKLLYQFIRSIHVGQQQRRLSITTFLIKFKMLEYFHKTQKRYKKARQYHQRWKAIASIYRNYPDIWYLLDQTLYSHHWGTFGISFK